MKTSVLPCLPTLRGFVGKLLLFTLLACVGFAQVGKAIDYTWVGSLGPNWAAGGNWSPTAPLGGPTSGDNVIFNNANSCGITSPVTVNSITLASTYTGVLTLSTGSLSITGTSGLTVAGGTFSLQITAVAFSVTQIIQTGGSIDLSSLSSLLLNSLNILGGYFYCPTNANLFINGNVIINTAFFFNQGSTIIMQGSGNSTLTIANNVSLYNLTISKPVGNSVTLSSGSTLNIFPELKISSGTFDAGLGTIKTNIFTQATNTTFTAPSGTMRVSGNFSVNSNNFMPNGGTIEFNTGGDGLFDYIVGGNQLNDVTINKTFGAKLTINSNMVLRNLYLQNGGFVTNSSQAVTAIGNVRIDQNFIYDLNNPKLIFQGGVSQSFSPVGSVTRSYGGIIEMNNSNGITIGYNGTGGKLKIENEFKFLASGKVLLGDDLIFGTSATISNANNSRYFVTTGAGNLLKNYSATPTLFNFPVGSATRYAPIGIKPSGATDISVSYQPSPTNLPENTMKTNASNTLVRRSINEVWECTSTNNIDIEPYMYVTNAAASGISNTSNLDIAIKITGSNWFSFQSEDDGKYTAYSAAPIPLVGLPLPTLYGFGDAVNVGTSFYLTFGSRTTTDNFLGTSSPRITNCKDAIPVALNTDVNTLVPSGYLAGVSAVSCYVSTVVASQWYEVVGTGQTLALTYQNTSSFTTLEVFSGGCDVLAPVGCGTATTFMAGAYINLYFNTNAGETYKIRLATTSPTSTGILRIAPAPTPVITAPVLGDATQTSFTAKWSAISGASDYQIDVSTSTDFSSPIVNGAPTLGNTNFNIIGLAAGNTYYYRVRAMFGTIASANSSVQNITLIPQSPVLSMSGYTNTNASFVVDFTGSTGATEYLLTVTDQLTMLVFGTYTLPNANLFTVSGLTPNRSYEIAVQSRNAMGTSPIPSSASRATLPNPPVNLNYTATNNSLTLTWDAPVGGAFNYDVSTDGGSSFPSFTSNGTTLTITITGLSPSTFYSVIVRSRTQQGFVAGTNAQNITTLPLPPNTPTGLALVPPAGATSFILTWDTEPTATSYTLVITSPDIIGYNQEIPNIPTNIATVNVPTGGVTYQCIIKAVNGSQESTYSGALDVVLLLTPPVASDATNVTENSYTANWISTGIAAATYNVYVSTDNLIFTLPASNQGLSGTSLNITGLVSNTTYYYRVTTVVASVESIDFSTTINVTTAPPPPSVFSAINIANNGFQATWQPVPIAGTTYKIQVSAQSDFSSFLSVSYVNGVNTGANLFHDVYTVADGITVSPNTFYYYRVKSVGVGGQESSYSASATVITLPNPPIAQNPTVVNTDNFTARWFKPTNQGNAPYTYTYTLQVTVNGGTLISIPDIDLESLVVDSAVLTAAFGSPVTITSGTAITYQVLTKNASGVSVASNGISFTTKLNAPVLGVPTNITANSFTANWGFVAGATAFYIDVSTEPTFTIPAALVSGYNNFNVGINTSIPVVGLTTGIPHYFRVRAGNGTTNISENSFTIAVLPPPTLSATPVADIFAISFNVAWTAPTGATAGTDQYAIDVATNANFTNFVASFENLNIGNATNTTVIGLLPNTAYFVRVRCIKKGIAPIPDVPTGNSNVITVLTKPTAPTSLPATNIQQTQFTARWNLMAGISSYRVEVSNLPANFATGIFVNTTVSNADNLIVTGLSANTAYSYRVFAVNATDDSAPSAEQPVTTLINPPANPVPSDATLVTANSFQANWDTYTGIGTITYRLQVATDAGFANLLPNYTGVNILPDANFSAVTGLTANTTYYYRVRRVEDGAFSVAYSDAITVVTAPVAPTLVSVSELTNNRFKINWFSPATAVAGYSLEVRRQADSFTILNVADILPDSISKLVNTGLTGNTAYIFRMRAKNTQNIFSNIAVGSTLTKPSAPTVVTTSNVQSDRFTLSWAMPAGGVGDYLLDVATTPDFIGGFVVNNQSIGALVSSQVIVGLEAGKVYFARIYGNNTSGRSDASATVAIITRPIASDASTITTTGFTASWSKVTGASSYRLYVAKNASFTDFVAGYSPKSINDVNIDADILTGLTTSQNYYYKVVAVRDASTNPTIASAESPESNAVLVTTLPTAPTLIAQNFGETTTTTNQVLAKWNFVAGAEAYYLDVATTNTFSAFVPDYNNRFVGALNNFVVLGLNPDSTYYFRVRAGKGGALSANSLTGTLKTAPSFPISLTTSNVTSDGFTLEWNHNASATLINYEVSLYELPSPLNPVLVSTYNMVTVPNTDVSFPFSGLDGGKTYRAEIRALNSMQYSTWVRPANAVILPPDAPTTLPATTVVTNSFLARWNSVSSATSYRLDVANNLNFTPTLPAYTNLTVTGTDLTVNVTSTSVTHYYRVRAVGAGGTSNNSDTREVSIPATPVITINGITNSQFQVNWTAVANADNYALDVSVDVNFGSFVQVGLGSYQGFIVGNVTNFVVPNLTAGSTYYVRLRALNTQSQGSSGYSNAESALLIPNAPDAPEDYTTTNIVISGASSSFTANWQASLGATEYFLDVSTETNFSTYLPNYQNRNVGNVTTFEVSPVTNDETYYFRVRAKNATGTSADSPAGAVGVAILPAIDLNTPAQPTSFSLSSVVSTEVEISWQDNANNEDDFEIQRSDAFAGTYTTIHIFNGSNTNTPQILNYTDTGLTPITTYWYRIRARNSTSASAYTAPQSVRTATDAPEIPQNLYAVSNDATSIYLEWDDKSDNENSFKLYRAIDEAGAVFTLVTTLPANTENYTDTGLTTFTAYKYYVTALKGTESEPSNVAFARAAPVPLFPSNLTATAFNTNTIDLAWSDNSNNETEFVIEVASVETEESFEVEKAVTANITTLRLTQTDGVKANHKYVFRMFARNAEGKSRYSNEATVNTPINPTIPIPLAPTGLIAESVSTIEIKLRWQDNAANEDYFIVMRSGTGLPASFAEIKRIEANSTNFSDITVVGYQRYYYQVIAVNGGGSSAPSNISFTNATCNPILVLVPDNPSGSGAIVCDTKHVEMTLNTNVTAGKFLWYRNDILIPNANLPRYLATETGDYYCRVIAGDCDKKTPELSVIVNPSFSVSVIFDLGAQQFRANYTGANKYQWYYNYTAITGANAETYKPTQTGSYYVVVTEGACSATSNLFPFTSITGVESFDISHQIKLYPNPSKAQEVQLQIENDLLTAGEITLFDQYGAVRRQVKIKKDAYDWHYKLSLLGLPSGMYLIEVRYGKYAGKQRLIVID